MLRIILTLLAFLLIVPRADAATQRLVCTAWGGSHTGRYTFDLDDQTCRVNWLEIDTVLDPVVCQPPRIVVIKPFAPASGYVLKFNLKTGVFSDHVPGWADRGACTRVEQ